MKIVSGGQTGVDRAALDVAIELGIPCGGWCPQGRLAEDGVIPARYPLAETPSPNYEQRTEWNVRDSDGTLVLTLGEPTGGTAFTVELAQKHRKPHLVVFLDARTNLQSVSDWIASNQIETLNVAGPRLSTQPESYRLAAEFLRKLLAGKRS